MELLLVTLLNACLRMLLFMLASGLTLIFSMMGVLNFAHASVYSDRRHVAYQISQNSRLRRLWSLHP
jgi:branched-chain amino acid transport system permease protein